MRSENKADWGPGPWQGEPDLVDWVDEEIGLHCRIVRGPVGSLCGYVAVPREHPAWGMSYDPVEYIVDENIEWWRRHVTQRVEYKISDIRVHGGLTFAGVMGEDGTHWFGFDCSHADDYSPGLFTLANYDNRNEVYRDIAYVTQEVKSLAKQLANIKKENYE